MIDNREAEERVILVAVRKSDRENTEQSLDELCELASTAGAVTVARVIQNLDNFNPATYIGKGKIDEIKELIIEYDATGIICDDELSPAQMNNLSDALEIKSWTERFLFSIFLQQGLIPTRVRFRLSLPS